MDTQDVLKVTQHDPLFGVCPSRARKIHQCTMRNDKYVKYINGFKYLNDAGVKVYSEKIFPVLKTDLLLSADELKTISRVADGLHLMFEGYNGKVCRFHYMRDYIVALSLGKEKSWDLPHPSEIKKTDRRGCCRSCGYNNGYFHIAEDGYCRSDKTFQKQIKELQTKFGWSKKFGFWSPEEMGCVLPRGRRSDVCSGHCCDYFLQELARAESMKVREIRVKHKIIY